MIHLFCNVLQSVSVSAFDLGSSPSLISDLRKLVPDFFPVNAARTEWLSESTSHAFVHCDLQVVFFNVELFDS